MKTQHFVIQGNTREVGDLRRYLPHYDVIVMARASPNTVLAMFFRNIPVSVSTRLNESKKTTSMEDVSTRELEKIDKI